MKRVDDSCSDCGSLERFISILLEHTSEIPALAESNAGKILTVTDRNNEFAEEVKKIRTNNIQLSLTRKGKPSEEKYEKRSWRK